ncbi:uncharacterized protein LOC100374528 [Saccoglossus kowalevskii]|uniref:Uncharacterized protein LOC100374528 n=1 Tax=Saccoglossus kowalevskii TaxID=10224 RepID=A0ABM0GQZ4_SACKO|nr:PREDICTED: uncharacterized protein LOC100374528 [Saccoglossus kowalevskii]
MASLPVDDCDGIIHDVDHSSDEVDFGTAVIHLSRDADIPPKYFLHKIFSPMMDDMSSYQRCSERPPKLKLLHKDWGHNVSKILEGPGVLALVALEKLPLDEHHAMRVYQYITDRLKHRKCEILRWDITHLLLYFHIAADYENLGQLFLDGKLDDCEGFKVIRIEPCVLTNPPRCMVEIEMPINTGDLLRTSMIPIITPFSSALTHVTIRETGCDNNSDHSEDGMPPSKHRKVDRSVPSVGVTMMFTGQMQRRAVKSAKCLASAPWEMYSLPEAVTKVVDYDTQYFHNVEQDMPMWAVKTGCPMSGIRMSLFVRERSNFDTMDQFYRNITGLTPFERDLNNSDVRYATFTLSPKAEFTLVHYPGVNARSLENVSLYFRVNSPSKAIGAEKVSDDHWQLKDFEGNRVVLFLPTV